MFHCFMFLKNQENNTSSLALLAEPPTVQTGTLQLSDS